MAKATLTISSKNYSSWSLRGWLLTKFAGLDFEEIVVSPDDPDAPTLDKQSRYELGRADLVITGSGIVTVSGHGYAAPHRLRLPAGLYQVDGEVITLRDGERREVEARPR